MSLLHLWEDVKQNEWIDIPAGWLQVVPFWYLLLGY